MSSDSELIGLVHVPLSSLLSEVKTSVRLPSGGTGLRQSTTLQCNIKGISLGDVIGEVTLHLSMDDYGPTQPTAVSGLLNFNVYPNLVGTVCIVGGTACIVGGTVCIVGGTVCIVGGTVCIVGGTVCIVVGTVCIVGGTVCIVGGTVCIVGGTCVV